MQINKLTLAVWMVSGLCAVQANTQLSPVTVTASPIHEHGTFIQPSQVDSVTTEEKAERDSGSLGELLEAIPGVNNMSSGAQSGKPMIRGMTGNRVKVLSNGQSTDYQAYGNRHNPNIEPYLAETVEVVRGPQSVLYGSEAVGGVVNVIQAQIPYRQGVQGELVTELNSSNQETLFGTKVGAGSNAFGVVAGVSKRKGDNYHVPAVSSANGVTPSDPAGDLPLFVGEVPNTNFENQSAYLGFGYQQDWGQIELRHTYWDSKQNYLGVEAADNSSPYTAVATGQKLKNDETQLKAEFYLQDWVLKPSWTHSRNQREAAHDLPYETMATEKGTEEYLDLLVKRDDLKLAIEHPALGDFEGEIGFELTEKAQILRSGHLTPSADESKRAIYVFEEADYDRWLVQLGARYDIHAVRAPLDGNNAHFSDPVNGVFDASNNQRDFGVLSGSLGATYRIDSQWSFATNMARGFRAPSIFELYAGGEHGGVQAYQIGNPNLKAETALNTDVSLRWQTAKTKLLATAYLNWVDNYIYLENSGYYRAKEGAPNEGERVAEGAEGAIVEMQAQQTDAVIHGLEFSLDHQWNSTWHTGLALEIIQGKDVINQQTLPLMPANNLRLSAIYSPKDWGILQQQSWGLETKLVASKKAAGDYEPFSQYDRLPFGRASTEAYALWNLRYSAELPMDKQRLQLAFSVENLLDTPYVDFLDTYKGFTLGQGRNLKLSARLQF